MIRINLIKQLTGDKKKKQNYSPRLLIIVFCIIGIALAGSASWWLFNNIKSPSPIKKQKSVLKRRLVGSTLTDANVVEEVVDDIDNTKDKLKKSGVLDFSYENLSFIEKVNYEIRFAKNVCDLLSKTVLPGVDFRNLEAKSFKSLYGVGVSNSKDNVIKVFKALKKEKFEILPKPYTTISREGSGYLFKISCNTKFGLDLEAPFFVGPENILGYEDLDMELKKMVRIAEDDGVRIKSGPDRFDATLDGDYRRIRYRLSGVSSYDNFVAFINNLYARNVQCAFEKFKLTALSRTSLQIDTDVIFTTSK